MALTAADLARLRLALIPGLGPITQLRLVQRFGSAMQVFRALDAVREFAGWAVAEALSLGPDERLVERIALWLEVPRHRLVAYEHEEYPQLLREIASPPGVLYALGDPALLARTSVAIVGARNATPSGVRDAREMARALSDIEICVVSGLAHGVDAAAHLGGLEGPGSTIAVMGTGPDRFYPRRNHDLAERIAEKGCVLTEFPLGTPPLPGNFPRRNRLISGLAKAVVVVEANEKSGSLVTAHFGLEQNREVLAMPGSIHSPLSKGCHKLIKEGAALAECANDVLAAIGVAGSARTSPRTQREPRDAFLDALGDAPATLDQIASTTGLEAAAIAARLAMLQVEGAVEVVPGGKFQRVDRPA